VSVTSERYVCIHGHFYQPPRENPWLEALERQDSAYPHHDWNERVTAECYAPNATARVLDGDGRIVDLVNNYSRISFNIGPTLLAWLAEHAADVYQAIIDADGLSRARFGGHGSAIAQVYNHLIMPLANRRDKRTQIVWGSRDFAHRFGRRPEGMWLAETAVDLETLDLVAEQGIRFTILAPYQAGRVRRLGGRAWQDVLGGRIDPTMAYRQRLPSGRTIDLFFYDGPIARAVAFERLLNRGDDLANRLLGAFHDGRRHAQLVHIATDGESYGHHHRHGEMALAYALQSIEASDVARLTNYGEYLERHPPTHEVDIVENTAWSCSHGVDRWQSDCGCNSGGFSGWHQAWRAPLRAALDWLRDSLTPRFEHLARQLVSDPWAARDDYIDVILNRTPPSRERFLHTHTFRPLTGTEETTLWKLLEMQRHLQLMYTSCGWFFDELSGIETVQVIQYAGRAVQLAQALFGDHIEHDFEDRLATATSNLPEHQDGAHIYRKWVKPAMVDPAKVAAHYAIMSLFEPYPEQTSIYCYTVERMTERRSAAGRARLLLGRARFTSRVTGETGRFDYGVLHLGDHTIDGGVRPSVDGAADLEAYRPIEEAFERADILDVARLIDGRFGPEIYSLRALFRDEQRAIVGRLLEATLADDEAAFRQVYVEQAPLMRFLHEIGAPLPRAFLAAAEVILNLDLRRAAEADQPEIDQIRALVDQAATWPTPLDTAGVAYALAATIGRLTRHFLNELTDAERARALTDLVALSRALPFEVDLWPAQKDFVAATRAAYPERRAQAGRGDAAAQAWLGQVAALGDALGVRVFDMDDMPGPAPDPTALAAALLRQRRVPRATYRLQFRADFTFREAQALVPYLAELGVSDCYASPLFAASPGSDHGYDVVDYSRINPVLGDEAGLAELTATLQAHGLGLLLDMVPNHMGIGDGANVWWQDVLENGPSSLFADYFDIDWQPAAPELENTVLLPILEDQYGAVLESGKLRLAYADGAFFIDYYSTRLPVAPRSYQLVLNQVLPTLVDDLGSEHDAVLELQSILTALSYLPPRTVTAPAKIAERNREKEVIKRRLAALVEAHAAARAAMEVVERQFNGAAGDPASFDLLDQLLGQQAYRLAYWRVATDEINYRRFFDINQLAAIRVERPAVFRAVHRLVAEMLAAGRVTGLRIDHPDGLWDPTAYFRQLQALFVEGRLAADGYHPDLAAQVIAHLETRSPDDGAPAWPLYVVAEKILTPGEMLPPDWAVAGTTGYDFLNAVGELFVDGRFRRSFDRIYHRFTGREARFADLVNTSKKLVMLVALASEVNALGHRLERIAEKNRRYRDFTLASLTFALREVIAGLGVYRTYITGPGDAALPFNREHIRAAMVEARTRNPRTAAAIFDFIERTLLLANLDDFRLEDRAELVDFVMRFQQITGPVMAKGVEDTAFYRYHRLASLNEVGGHPEQFGLSVSAFHRLNLERQRRWPESLLATATHDGKRGEDVRARINVLSELPQEWRSGLGRWSRLAAAARTTIDGVTAPDRNDEYLLYQTLIGAWPAEWMAPDAAPSAAEVAAFAERIAAYMLKAAKEAKVHTSWYNPNVAYETALDAFVRRVLDDDAADGFRADLGAFARRVAAFGRVTSLAQTLLKLTCPGVPDLYQGAELWDLNLVDPDNRRPVDFDRRQALMADLAQRAAAAGDDRRALVGDLLAQDVDGQVKLYLIARTLAFRRDRADLFTTGAYLPLDARGSKREHVVAFARGDGDETALVVVPRLVVGLTGGAECWPLDEASWADTALALPAAWADWRWRNVLTGEDIAPAHDDGAAWLPLAALCAHCPVALLERKPSA
jgi:(1->4)-alpha-D-glucan 1-alpha-D-glucosylmutase